MESPQRSVTLNALTGLDTGQEIIVETITADLAQAKESHRWLSNIWCCKRMRSMVRSPA
jgi:hypothetical protein